MVHIVRAQGRPFVVQGVPEHRGDIDRCRFSVKNSARCAVCVCTKRSMAASCRACAAKCATCVGNAGKCLECSADEYIDQTTAACNATAALTHCTAAGALGCRACEPGFFLELGNCVACPAACVTSTSLETCQSCADDFVVVDGACVPFTAIDACMSAHDGVCTSCADGYFLSEGKCFKDTNTTLAIVLPVVACPVVFVVVTFIVVIFTVWRRRAKKADEQRSHFKIARSNVAFVPLGNARGLVTNRTALDFQFDVDDDTPLPVEEESRDVVCVGTLGRGRQRSSCRWRNDFSTWSCRDDAGDAE